MKKRLLKFVFIIIGVSISFAQKSISGEVIYKFTNNKVSEEKRKKSKELYGFLDLMNKSSSNLEFVLTFNSNESFFEIENKMDSDKNKMGLSFAKNIVSKGKYYYNKDKDSLLRESSFYDKYTLIHSKPSETLWELKNERKRISSYLCYKATTLKKVIKGNSIRNFLIEAWYVPSIPMPYGPNEFNGLPGLILELKDVNYTFYISKIKFLKNEKTIVKPLESKNIISEIEHLNNTKNVMNKY